MIKKYAILFFILARFPAYPQTQNLLINEALTHASKIKSDLTYSNSTVSPGEYTISNQAEANNPSYVTPPNTTKSFLIADMSEEFAGKRIWYTTIKLDTGKTYLFSIQAANIHKNFENPPAIRLTVNGKNIGKIFKLPNNSNDWMVCSAYYSNGNKQTEVTVAVENFISISLGNDLALYDFSFAETENIYLKYSRQNNLPLPKKDSLSPMVKLTDTLPKKDTTIKPLEIIKTDKIVSQKKDSSLQAKNISIKQNHTSQKKNEPIPSKKITTPETKKTPPFVPPAKLKSGDGIRAPKNEQASLLAIPETMMIPRKKSISSNTTTIQKKENFTKTKATETTPPTKKITVKKDSKKVPNATTVQIKDSTKHQSAFTKPPEIGEKIRLGQVYFEQGTSTLTNDSFRELENFVQYLNLYPKVRIRLEGHTDTQGDSSKNILLSEQRVQYLKQYLVEKGINGDRIEWKGYGSTKPLNSNRIEGLRKLNRRVEVVLLSK